MLVALTRELSPAFVECELTHLARQPIDLDLARVQHEAYETCLRQAGCRVERLAAGPEMPDSVFIEDTAVVADELAIAARPGAVSRRIEVPAVAEALGRHRNVQYIQPPGTIDGGDVLVLGRQVFVGRSSRTNQAGIDQIRALLVPYGYAIVALEVHGCLHLKSAVTALDAGLLLVNPAWLPATSFKAYERVEVHSDEPAGANALRVGDRVVYSTSFPRTEERLRRRGIALCTVDTSEVAKAEGAVTCCSLIFKLLTES